MDLGNSHVILLEESDSAIAKLIEMAAKSGRALTIVRNGDAVAMVHAIHGVADPLQVHPDLRATRIADDAFAPADEDEWPLESR
jgi:hypothetical protein